MFSLLSRPNTSLATGTRDPFSLIDAMFNDWVGQRGSAALVSRARLDVAERDNAYEVRAELPGAKKDDISVDIDGSWVSITAKANTQSEKKEGEKLLYSERSHESFGRSFELPQSVDAARAVAKFENGVLTLTLPKKDGPRSTRLAIS
ncbi:MAG: Hsp20/alpha crystallin family protein [Piscinibacter sp.]|nr:Hsp20/alpha crystallin family protein [Piscinibacter sp.]